MSEAEMDCDMVLQVLEDQVAARGDERQWQEDERRRMVDKMWLDVGSGWVMGRKSEDARRGHRRRRQKATKIEIGSKGEGEGREKEESPLAPPVPLKGGIKRMAPWAAEVLGRAAAAAMSVRREMWKAWTWSEMKERWDESKMAGVTRRARASGVRRKLEYGEVELSGADDEEPNEDDVELIEAEPSEADDNDVELREWMYHRLSDAELAEYWELTDAEPELVDAELIEDDEMNKSEESIVPSEGLRFRPAASTGGRNEVDDNDVEVRECQWMYHMLSDAELSNAELCGGAGLSSKRRIQEKDSGPRKVEKMQHHWNGRDVG